MKLDPRKAQPTRLQGEGRVIAFVRGVQNGIMRSVIAKL